jgi:hypothetical protein
MAQAQKKPSVQRDQFTPDGVRLFNPSKEHGTVYADGYCETKFIQEHEGRPINYRGDGTPVGYTPGQPLPPPVDVVEEENKALKSRIAELEAQQKKTLEILMRLEAAQAPAVPAKTEAAASTEAPASGAKPRSK